MANYGRRTEGFVIEGGDFHAIGPFDPRHPTSYFEEARNFRITGGSFVSSANASSIPAAMWNRNYSSMTTSTAQVPFMRNGEYNPHDRGPRPPYPLNYNQYPSTAHQSRTTSQGSPVYSSSESTAFASSNEYRREDGGAPRGHAQHTRTYCQQHGKWDICASYAESQNPYQRPERQENYIPSSDIVHSPRSPDSASSDFREPAWVNHYGNSPRIYTNPQNPQGQWTSPPPSVRVASQVQEDLRRTEDIYQRSTTASQGRDSNLSEVSNSPFVNSMHTSRAPLLQSHSAFEVQKDLPALPRLDPYPSPAASVRIDHGPIRRAESDRALVSQSAGPFLQPDQTSSYYNGQYPNNS